MNYVDDATYSYASDDPRELSDMLNTKYKCIAEYMAANKLVINADKTHLLVIGVPDVEKVEGFEAAEGLCQFQLNSSGNL